MNRANSGRYECSARLSVRFFRFVSKPLEGLAAGRATVTLQAVRLTVSMQVRCPTVRAPQATGKPRLNDFRGLLSCRQPVQCLLNLVAVPTGQLSQLPQQPLKFDRVH